VHVLYILAFYHTGWQCKQNSTLRDLAYTLYYIKHTNAKRVHTEQWNGCPGLSRTIYVIFHVFPGLFNRVDIEQVRFSYTFNKSINESAKHVAHNTEYVHNYTKQQIKVCLTVDNDDVCKGRKHIHESKMQQPFGLFSMTLQHIRLIPWLSGTGKFEF